MVFPFGRDADEIRVHSSGTTLRPSPMKTRLALLALALTLPALGTPPVYVPELSSTLPLLVGGLFLLGVLARRLKK